MPLLPREQRVAIAIGVPIAAILLYILFRRLRSDEFDDEDDVETDYNEVEDVASTSETTIEVKVPRSIVGQVIGKSGANIKKIQKESGARLNFTDGEDEDSQERTAIIRGEREKVKKAELLIKKIIATQPAIIAEEIYVPKQACGRIIGRGGQNIRQISRISGAKVVVESNSEVDPQAPLRKVTLTGTIEQILHARGLLEEKVTEESFFAAQKGANKGKGYQVFLDNKETGSVHDTVSTFPVGSEYVKVFVSALNDPSSFYVQLITEKASALETMNAELTKEISAETSVLNGFKIGDLCCAPFDVDNCWYRARITKIGQDDMVDVFYVDFGDSDQVHKTRLRVLKNKYRTLPHQAVHCSLANFRPKDGRWSEAAKEAFEELTFCAQWQVLMARVVRYSGENPCVELIDTNNSEKDINIGEELVKRQFAVFDESFPSENDIKDAESENLELNQEPTVMKGDSSRGKLSKLDECDLRTVTKSKADEEFLRCEDQKKKGSESILYEMEKMAVNEDASPYNHLTKQQIIPGHFDAEEKQVARTTKDNGEVGLSCTEQPALAVESSTTVSAIETAESPNDFRLTDQIDAVVAESSEMKLGDDVTSLHKPIAPRNESSHIHYAVIKTNHNIDPDDHPCNEENTAVLESLLEEKLQVGMEASSDSLNQNNGSSLDDPKCSAFVANDLQKQIKVTDNSESQSTMNKDDNEVSTPDKQCKTENVSVMAPTEKKTFVSSVSVITKKKAQNVFVTVSSSDEKPLERKILDGLKIQPAMSNMTSKEAKRASTELVINVSSNTEESLPEIKKGESEETFTSIYSKVLNTHDGNHCESHGSAIKMVGKVQQDTISVDPVADFDSSDTSPTLSLKDSPNNSDTDSFLSAREEVTSDTDTTTYLTAQASGSTTSLDYQSLDSDADTVQLDISLDTAHTPVNSDIEDDVDAPTTPRTLFGASHYDDKCVQSVKVPPVDLTENELGYGADTESVTSKEDLRQFGIS